jgi:predicted CopG family antitoxin
MPSKTISLEIDAYERLKATRIRGESFSAVVRRITLPSPKATAAELLADVRSGRFGRGIKWAAVKAAVARRSRSKVARAS